MALVDDVEDAFDVRLGMQAGVEGCVPYCGRELAVGQDVCVRWENVREITKRRAQKSIVPA